MKTERPWAAQGDNWEVIVPDGDDLAASLTALPEPTPEEMAAAAQRYLTARYGGLPAADG